MDSDWAFISLGNDRVAVGVGPFTQMSECPIGQTAFYQNSFSLKDQAPWFVPRSFEVMSKRSFQRLFPGTDENAFEWQEPEVAEFSSIFDQIQGAIQQGVLKKSVPVAVETAACSPERFQSLAGRLMDVHENLHPYGFWQSGRGFIGGSPEYLFRSFEGKLKTMALAGTATEAERAVFTVDEKEIREHEFVAQTLLEVLTPLGMTRRHARDIISLGHLIHFHTAVDVELYRSHRPDDLIRHMHPTPALGPLPRTDESMMQLMSWRARMGCPSSFGAPFGLYHQGRLELLVAIRMLAYENSQLVLPAGCGVIEPSRLTNEWRELERKRSSVKAFFALR